MCYAVVQTVYVEAQNRGPVGNVAKIAQSATLKYGVHSRVYGSCIDYNVALLPDLAQLIEACGSLIDPRRRHACPYLDHPCIQIHILE